jgi:hypothetical protein
MLSYCRPHGSLTEQQFIRRFIEPLPGAYEDQHRNWHVVTDAASPVLWSAHTDTVHRMDGRQTTHYDPATGLIGLSKRSKFRGRNCLGADDTVGVYLMIEMVKANVPGHYVFHFGEEVGGIGSRAYAESHADALSQFKYAIALDRSGHTDIITHQYGGRTASETFATALGAALDPCFAPCHGVYTDTAEYSHLIPECTNLSVGYAHAHSANETVHVAFVEWLLGRLLTLDVTSLPVEREAKEEDTGFSFTYYGDWPEATVTPIDPPDSPYDDLSFDELEDALDLAERLENWPDYRAIEEEMWKRLDAVDADIPTCDSFLDSDYADVQRALTLCKVRKS